LPKTIELGQNPNQLIGNTCQEFEIFHPFPLINRTKLQVKTKQAFYQFEILINCHVKGNRFLVQVGEYLPLGLLLEE